MPRGLVAALVSIAAFSAALSLVACEDSGPTGTSAASSGAGGMEGCAVGPQPLLTITITAEDGPLPSNTKIVVTWSAGEEPAFVLGDPSTWKTLEDGVNVVCDVHTAKAPPRELEELVCELWTSGATAVEVKAPGYVTYEETFSPAYSEACHGPIPTAVTIELEASPDAG